MSKETITAEDLQLLEEWKQTRAALLQMPPADVFAAVQEVVISGQYDRDARNICTALFENPEELDGEETGIIEAAFAKLAKTHLQFN